MSESFAELFEESLKSLDMQPGAIITGIVVDIDGDWSWPAHIYVDAQALAAQVRSLRTETHGVPAASRQIVA